MPQIAGTVQSSAPPAAGADGTAKGFTPSRYGEMYVIPVGHGELGLAEQGSAFHACNATFGTGIAMGIQTTFSDTANVLAIIRNTAGAGGKRIVMNYIRLVCTAAGSSTTSSQLGLILDNANRYSTGGTDLTGNIVNVNTEGAPTSIADIRFGIVTALAAVNKRQVTRAVLKTQAAPCWVVGDQLLINFGFSDATMGPKSGAAATLIAVNAGRVILGAGNNHSLLVHMWNPANATTAPSWECEFAWWER